MQKINENLITVHYSTCSLGEASAQWHDTGTVYWIVITSCSIYLLSIDLSFSEINVAPHNSGIPVMLSYAPPYFGWDIIISFFAVCKIIIGEVQLRSFIGNFQERQIYLYIYI